MESEIEQKINAKFDNYYVRILVEYEQIRTYKITVILKHLPIESGIIHKTIVFDYDWLNNFMFDNNIAQLYYEIKTLLIKEEVWKYVARNDYIEI